MTEDPKRRLPIPTAPQLPTTTPGVPPTPALPSLPSSSGKFWGSATTIKRADAEFIRADAEVLQAKTQQATALLALADARIAVALKTCEFATLPEVARNAFEQGRMNRDHAIRALALKNQTDEVNLQIALASAITQLAQYQPQPEAPPPPPPPLPPTGLTPADVEKIAQAIPELKAETIQTLVYALGGLLAEKNK